jgi:sialidase-1
VDITSTVKKSSWSWYATGPGHAVQLNSGRIVVPANHNVLVNGDETDPYHSHIIYSDDRGTTWALGGLISLPSNESCLVERADGTIYLNCRTRKEIGRRVGALSRDGGSTFMEEWIHDELPEPTRHKGGCEGSIVRYSDDVYLFCNPATTSDERSRLTVRESSDCRTWSPGRLLREGVSAYSDMTVLSDGSILCLYERGGQRYSEALTLARFDTAWLRGE